MTRSTSRRFHRADLAHGADHTLVPTATFEDATGSSFAASLGSEPALRQFLGLAVDYSAGPISTVCLYLKPRGYTPPSTAPPEYLPSSFYFDVDRAAGVAAAAMLIVDTDGESHQWLTLGEQKHEGLHLVMDPDNPNFSLFPDDSIVPIHHLIDAVVAWAFGDELPPAAVAWRPASEHEVGWPAGAGY